MDKRLRDRIAIVTGSSSGIGKSIALRMAREGAGVCVVANHNATGGQATTQEITDSGERAIFVQADVSVQADCARVVEETVRTFGQIDVLVNNAGITRGCSLEDMDEAFWDTVIDTNLKSVYLMTRQAVAEMLARGTGAVVSTSSVHALATQPGMSAYAASKAGILGPTRALACEFGMRGIRFNCVLPSATDLSLHQQTDAAARAAWKPRDGRHLVMGRTASPDEIAAIVCFLASDDASYINGAAVPADGGMTAALKE